MQLLLMNDRSTIDKENRIGTRTVSAEACCDLKQTDNDEGRARDLQIRKQNSPAQPPHSHSAGEKQFPKGYGQLGQFRFSLTFSGRSLELH
jgi:hypothetical protein